MSAPMQKYDMSYLSTNLPVSGDATPLQASVAVSE
jgi:hypothetical protein